jgi:flagellar motor switch protein FliN/FliY
MADENVKQDDLNQMDDSWDEAMAESQTNAAEDEEPEVQHAQFEDFGNKNGDNKGTRKLEMLLDVMLPVTIELGRTKMYIKKILDLERGSIIELDKMAGEPVDLYINNKKMAEGEVVVVDKHFGVRITNLIDPADRIKNLGH